MQLSHRVFDPPCHGQGDNGPALGTRVLFRLSHALAVVLSPGSAPLRGCHAWPAISFPTHPPGGLFFPPSYWAGVLRRFADLEA